MQKVYYSITNKTMASSKGPHFQFEVQLPSNVSRGSFSALLEETNQR